MAGLNRRSVIAAVGGVAAHLATGASAQERAPGSMDTAKPFTIGMIGFDMMTNLDLVGPFDILSRVRGNRVLLLGKTTEPIRTDSGYRAVPDMRLSDAPALDMVFVPGGAGTRALMEDDEVIAFLRKHGPQAKWVTSVCTGALVLGAAGLLRGYRAATHWNAMHILPVLGAKPVNERVVIDRNRVTGGGVTAGIDFGLTLIAHIWGEDEAKLIQMGNEYNPKPPFDAGHPDRAPEVAARFRELTKGMTAARMEAAKRVAAKF